MPGAAGDVDVEGADLLRDAGADADLAPGVGTVPGLARVADDRLVDLVGLDVRAPHRLDRRERPSSTAGVSANEPRNFPIGRSRALDDDRAFHAASLAAGLRSLSGRGASGPGSGGSRRRASARGSSRSRRRRRRARTAPRRRRRHARGCARQPRADGGELVGALTGAGEAERLSRRRTPLPASTRRRSNRRSSAAVEMQRPACRRRRATRPVGLATGRRRAPGAGLAPRRPPRTVPAGRATAMRASSVARSPSGQVLREERRLRTSSP